MIFFCFYSINTFTCALTVIFIWASKNCHNQCLERSDLGRKKKSSSINGRTTCGYDRCLCHGSYTWSQITLQRWFCSLKILGITLRELFALALGIFLTVFKIMRRNWQSHLHHLTETIISDVILVTTSKYAKSSACYLFLNWQCARFWSSSMHLFGFEPRYIATKKPQKLKPVENRYEGWSLQCPFVSSHRFLCPKTLDFPASISFVLVSIK